MALSLAFFRSFLGFRRHNAHMYVCFRSLDLMDDFLFYSSLGC